MEERQQRYLVSEVHQHQTINKMKTFNLCLLSLLLIVVTISFVSAGLSQEAHNIPESGTGSIGVNLTSGVRIYANQNVSIYSITFNSQMTGSIVKVLNETGGISGVTDKIINQSSIINKVAQINVSLIQGRYYTISVTNESGTWNEFAYIDYPYPILGRTINWVNGSRLNVTGITSIRNIESIFILDNLYNINQSTYNTTSAETAFEGFTGTLNSASPVSSAILFYNNTAYSASVSNLGNNLYSLSRGLDIPLLGNNSYYFYPFYWNVTFVNGTNIISGSLGQKSYLINLTKCTSAPLNIPYINYTIKDEDTLSTINASIDSLIFSYYLGSGALSKSYTFLNQLSQNNLGICFSPSYLPTYVTGTIRYSNLTAYPQRIYSFAQTQYTNSTILNTLYLLNTANGIYSSIQTAESTGATISSVLITVERSINNEWVVVGQQETGSDGLSTFWVNPNYPHRITAEKTGYSTAQVTITPSQTTYTLVMVRSSGSATYNGTLTGIKWKTSPAIGPTDPGTYTFGFNLTASLGNLDGSYCKIELVNAETGASLSSTTGGSAYGCNLSLTYTLVEDIRYRGIYSIDTTETSGFVILDNDAYWYTLSKNSSNNLNLRSFFTDFRDNPDFGTGLRQEFSRTIAFFFILVMLIAIITFFTGYDFSNPGWAMIILLAPIAIASTVGFFTFSALSSNPWIQKYTILLILIFSIGGFVLNYISKNN